MSIQNEILNAIAARRSCRAYKPEQITAEELEAVPTAGTWPLPLWAGRAPSWSLCRTRKRWPSCPA